ncbi:hypothetical protein BACCAC_01812 [Bacteroides caccae ATCC 43185]|nr:hypothetical protein BACCAC_01812 [Bacteroides caccae ATCC 43185]
MSYRIILYTAAKVLLFFRTANYLIRNAVAYL